MDIVDGDLWVLGEFMMYLLPKGWESYFVHTGSSTAPLSTIKHLLTLDKGASTRANRFSRLP